MENLLNEAALLSARKDLKAITMEEVEEATIKVIVGPGEKKSGRYPGKEKAYRLSRSRPCLARLFASTTPGASYYHYPPREGRRLYHVSAGEGSF